MAAERSFGLIGMQERVALAGGSLEIDSAPGTRHGGARRAARSRARQTAAGLGDQAGRPPARRLADLLVLDQPVLAGERDGLGPARGVRACDGSRPGGSRRCGC